MDCDIQSIIFNGPEEILKKTEYTQPAIYIVSVILGKLLIQKGIIPSAIAGHSLGEYSALSLANVFNFETGLELVKVRSKSMAKAGLINQGTMAAIVGLDQNTVESICKSYEGDGIVVPANYNSPSQIVISGSINAVRWVMKTAKESGAKISVELNVSAAFHSPLMRPAREDLAEMLNSLEISDSIIPLFTNVNAKPIIKGNEIKESLIKQLEHPVLWSKSILAMKNKGIKSFIEVGPGNVLKGLTKRIDNTLICDNVGSLEQLEKKFV